MPQEKRKKPGPKANPMHRLVDIAHAHEVWSDGDFLWFVIKKYAHSDECIAVLYHTADIHAPLPLHSGKGYYSQLVHGCQKLDFNPLAQKENT